MYTIRSTVSQKDSDHASLSHQVVVNKGCMNGACKVPLDKVGQKNTRH